MKTNPRIIWAQRSAAVSQTSRSVSLWRNALRLVENDTAARRLAFVTLFFFAIVAPQLASAHGELQIQIAAVTKKIQTTTNNTAQLYLDRAELHREHQDWLAAESDYDRAAQLNPKLPDLDLYRAKMLDDSGELKAARKLFNKILHRSPKNGEAFIGRARVLVKLGDRPSAIGDFQTALDTSPSPQPEYFLELAQTFVAEKNTNAALQTLDRGIKKFGAILPLQSYALELELSRKNNAAALTRIDTLIARASRPENLLAQRGDILLATGQTNEALKSFEAALAAIQRLPSVLQKASPMQKLQARIDIALAGITNAAGQSRERGCVVLDQPQRVAENKTPGINQRIIHYEAAAAGLQHSRAPLFAVAPRDLWFSYGLEGKNEN